MFGLIITNQGNTSPVLWCRTEAQRDGIAADELADGGTVELVAS